MLFLGPQRFEVSGVPSRDNATSFKASRYLYNTILLSTKCTSSIASTVPSSVDLLSDLPSFQFLTVLSDLLCDPDGAFKKGVFKRISADSIDLPPAREPVDSRNSNLWTLRMPSYVQQLFKHQGRDHFISPLKNFVSAAKRAGTLPEPKVHASHAQYTKLLDKAEAAGMLHWTVVDHETQEHSDLADAVEMTLFAVSKSKARSRLISWPRVQNEALPDAPYTALPDPALFESLHVKGSSPSAFYLDIANMFHNIILPDWLAKLFPMKAVKLNSLSSDTVRRIRARLALSSCHQESLLRPYQATMPMGFKWSVFVAHNFVSSILHQAFNIFRHARIAPPNLQSLVTLCAEEAPFKVTKENPLLLHIIDDVAGVTVDWPSEATLLWYKISRNMLRSKLLPVSEQKSSPQDSVVSDAFPFIGCEWNLKECTVYPTPIKLAKTLQLANELLQTQQVTKQLWDKAVGKLVWFSLLNRPLLSCLQSVFHSGRQLEAHENMVVTMTSKREILTLAALLPLARVHINLPLSNVLIAFDASETSGAASFTYIKPALASKLWSEAQSVRASRSRRYPLTLASVEEAVSKYHWRRSFIHHWRNKEHIDGLEAAAAVIALEWAIRKGIRDARLLLLTDSLVALGAYQKGRSSATRMLARCRRFAALAIAHNLRVTLAYVPSELNPADKFTRLTTAHKDKGAPLASQ